MTKETNILAQQISNVKEKHIKKEIVSRKSTVTPYRIIVDVLIDLFGPLLIGISLGVFCRNMFDTSPSLTIGLGLLGAVAGLVSVVRYAIELDKKGMK